MSLYPLLFDPSFHYRIWGGNKLHKLGKLITEKNIGESWEISTVPNFVSKVSDGSLKGENLNELVSIYKEDLVGFSVYKKYGNNFPLLIKFLDTEQPLSVQVHPNDIYAKKHHNSLGKTEMWYVMEAEEDAEVIIGFKKNITKDIFSEYEKNNQLEEILRKIHPKKGDVIYIPAGRVHALGKGLLIAEIQQTSDVTYRIFDYNRIDKDGTKRDLHIERAKEVIDFSYTENAIMDYNHKSSNELLIDSPYFVTTKHIIEDKTYFKDSPESFRIIICLEGNGKINSNAKTIEFQKGQSILIPACLKQVEISNINRTPITLLEIHI